MPSASVPAAARAVRPPPLPLLLLLRSTIICTHSIVSPFPIKTSREKREERRGEVYNCYLLAFKNFEYSPPTILCCLPWSLASPQSRNVSQQWPPELSREGVRIKIEAFQSSFDPTSKVDTPTSAATPYIVPSMRAFQQRNTLERTIVSFWLLSHMAALTHVRCAG